MNGLALLGLLVCGIATKGPGDAVHVNCRTDTGLHASFLFPWAEGPSTVYVARPSSPAPWAVREYPGGSDVHYWWLPLDVRPDGVFAAIREPLHSTSQDAVCASNSGAGFGILRHIWGSEADEWHYAPHRYELVSYARAASGLYAVRERRRTTRRYVNWQAALAELRTDCTDLKDELARQ